MYGNGPDFDLMFYKHDGMNARRNLPMEAAKSVEKLPEADFKVKADEQIITELKQKFGVVVPTLKPDEISFERQTTTLEGMDVWGDYRKREVPVFYFDIPFEGEADIFSMQANAYDSAPPRGRVFGKTIRVAVVNEEDPQKLKAEIDRILEKVERYLGWHRAMWAGLDEDIAREAGAALKRRREQLSKLGAAEAGLANMGFKPKTTN